MSDDAAAPLSRVARKERTRRAILDAALRLCEDSSLVAVSLRQVAKEVGIVPTAFYRHFDSVEDLGLALVDESFVSLRAMLRDPRRDLSRFDTVIDDSVRILVEHVELRRAHFLFIARERAAGPAVVRAAVLREIDRCAEELTDDLMAVEGIETWAPGDVRVLSDLFVSAMVWFAEAYLRAAGDPDLEKQQVETARAQLRMVLVGAIHWQSRP